MFKQVFILPSFGHSAAEDVYARVGKIFKARGIEPVYVNLDWGKPTILDNYEEFLKVLRKSKVGTKYIFGFSFGALIAYMAAASDSVDTLVLCSLSPYMAEDMPRINQEWREAIRKEEFETFKKISNFDISQKVVATVYLLYGSNEPVDVKRRVRETFDSLTKGKHLIEVSGAGHDISNGKYLNEISRVVASL